MQDSIRWQPQPHQPVADDGMAPSFLFQHQAAETPRTPQHKFAADAPVTPSATYTAPMQMATTAPRRRLGATESRTTTRHTEKSGFDDASGLPTLSLIDDDADLFAAPSTTVRKAAAEPSMPSQAVVATLRKPPGTASSEHAKFQSPSATPSQAAVGFHHAAPVVVTGAEVSRPLETDRALRDRVVVFGLPADSVQNVLRKFQEFGDIVDYHVGQGNWMIIRYATPLQAEKALGQTSVLLSSNVLLGVMKLTSQLARRLNIQIRDGDTVQPVRPQEKATLGAREAVAMKNYRRFMDVDDSDILQPPKRRKNICTQLLEAVFNW